MNGSDLAFMRRAITLARGNLGETGTNPAVGCVLVAGDAVVGEGVTARGGRPHAEEQALAQAGPRARGATAFVTLEPCAVRSSGGQSCSELLVAAGVVRVVVACRDPSVFAAGGGLERLRAEGVVLDVGLLADEASPLYASYRPGAAGAESK